MGTLIRIVLWAPDRETAKKAADAAFAEFKKLDALLSDYKADSELSRLNAAAGTGPRKVSPDLFEVLRAAQEYGGITGGFDPTVGPLVTLWRRARKERKLPDNTSLAQALARTGADHLQLNDEARTADLEKAGMKLDLGGIAKGYACDRALAALKKHGVTRALVDAGGGMAMSGVPPDRPYWRVKLADTGRYLRLPRAMGLATSGDLYQYVEIDGVRYSHIVDPRTGLGLTNRAMVTVIAPDGMRADVWSTALSVLGPEPALRVVPKLKDTEVWMRWVDADGRTREAQSDGFAAYVETEPPPKRD